MRSIAWAKTPQFFLKPLQLFRAYDRVNLRPDIIGGLTTAVIVLPQAIAYASIAELPPQTGLYAAVFAAIIGGLWGSSNHLHTGPTNAASLLALTILLPIAEPGTPEFFAAVGVLTVMVGLFRLALGVARLGLLANFVSDSVIIGFTAGAGVLISIGQIRPFLRLDFPSSPFLLVTLEQIKNHINETHLTSFLLGIGVLSLMILLRYFKPKWPIALISMIGAALLVVAGNLTDQGVQIIGQLPRSLPPIAALPLDFTLIGQLSSGALAVGAIGLIEATAIARSIASQSGQRLDTNQEFVGQGLANIAAGFFSGYTVSGSFTRSMINYQSGARTPFSSVFSGIFVLIAMLIFGPLAAFVPRAALASVLFVSAYSLIDKVEIKRIARGTRGDAIIMVVTFLATLFLPLQFAVLTGILLSFAVYIMRTSLPRIVPVQPESGFRHFTHQPDKEPCPQLAVFDILGDMYFGAANHVAETLRYYLDAHPQQRFLLLRMHSVHQCDISGIHALESMRDMMKERGGDVFFMRVRQPVMKMMHDTGLYQSVGADHFLTYENAISNIFLRTLDPAICIYECKQRVFLECQNLPRQEFFPEGAASLGEFPQVKVPMISPRELWEQIRGASPPRVVDVREPREYKRGHIPQAECLPLSRMKDKLALIPKDSPVVFVCRGGRRSMRMAAQLTSQGFDQVSALRGGILAWEAVNLLEAVEYSEAP
ncbi:MAG: SulP family inorganic anion transporter [Chloroflexota bacterium]